MDDVSLGRARDTARGDDQAATAPSVRPSKAGPLAALFRDHAEALRSYIGARFGPGPPEPEDVVQTAFAKVADAPNFEDVRDLRAFLYATACNFVIDQRRQAVRHAVAHRDIRYLNEASLSDSSSEDVLITKERLAIYQSALQRMPAMRRRIFLMVRVQGHAPAELAARFGISESAVNKHVGRALADCAAAQAKADARAKR